MYWSLRNATARKILTSRKHLLLHQVGSLQSGVVAVTLVGSGNPVSTCAVIFASFKSLDTVLHLWSVRCGRRFTRKHSCFSGPSLLRQVLPTCTGFACYWVVMLLQHWSRWISYLWSVRCGRRCTRWVSPLDCTMGICGGFPEKEQPDICIETPKPPFKANPVMVKRSGLMGNSWKTEALSTTPARHGEWSAKPCGQATPLKHCDSKMMLCESGFSLDGVEIGST